MNSFKVERYGRTRFWEVRDASGELICVCVYKRGAVEVARRLCPQVAESDSMLRDAPPAGPANADEPAIP